MSWDHRPPVSGGAAQNVHLLQLGWNPACRAHATTVRQDAAIGAIVLSLGARPGARALAAPHLGSGCMVHTVIASQSHLPPSSTGTRHPGPGQSGVKGVWRDSGEVGRRRGGGRGAQARPGPRVRRCWSELPGQTSGGAVPWQRCPCSRQKQSSPLEAACRSFPRGDGDGNG